MVFGCQSLPSRSFHLADMPQPVDIEWSKIAAWVPNVCFHKACLALASFEVKVESFNDMLSE